MPKEEKRKALALQAYPMLVEKGVDKFSLNALLSEASMSKGNFYHHFKDKYDLFYEVFSFQYTLVMMDFFEKKEQAVNFEERVFNFFFIYMDERAETQALFKLYHDMYFLFTDEKNENLYQFMQTMYHESFVELETIFQEAIESKALKKEALEYVKPMIATADGMFMHAFMLKDFNIKVELSKYLKNMLKVLS